MSNLFSGISERLRAGRNNRGKIPELLNETQPIFPKNSNSPPPMEDSSDNTLSVYPGPGLPPLKPLWLNKAYVKHIVKGNFMTLSTQPKTIEQGEWIAHQVVEHYKLLCGFVKVILDKDENGETVCNAKTCPRMSASDKHCFTWLNSTQEPVEISAHDYIALVQCWISGKIDDTTIFPTDPASVSAAYALEGLSPDQQQNPIPTDPTRAQLYSSNDWVGKGSGYPPELVNICYIIFRLMFRIYGHLYWSHFVDPVFHLGLEKHLNSSFSHFILTATEIDMLKTEELQPMQPLIDLWAANGTFPPESKVYKYADLQAGQRLLTTQELS
ncbi:putative protein kinase activator (Mob2) [Sclerotinia borealis F-4128]|uniref:Uncharacterized protein n=1 Tax=Sclerotinia borealis (strain F-4128) TaxID=1432307 RepID=W9C5E2_SCLBF|nr:putative protein kinase activator (Mob2) [Sclerotinia borealis F-4128]